MCKLPEIYGGKEILRITVCIFLTSVAADKQWLPVIT